MYQVYLKKSSSIPIISEMFSQEFLDLLKHVVTSWQVIAVTVVILIYMNIVTHVSRSYNRPRVKKMKPNKPKKAEPVVTQASDEIEITSDSNDDLGLEEQE